MRILDLSAGKRAQWYDKNRDVVDMQHLRLPDTIHVDIRPQPLADATVRMDTKRLLFKDSMFDLISFDPPHMCCGPASKMAKQYGHWTTQEILDLITGTAKEAHRVAKPDAILTLKWNDHDIGLERVLVRMDEWWEPLYGQTTAVRDKHKSATTWTVFKRRTGGVPSL